MSCFLAFTVPGDISELLGRREEKEEKRRREEEGGEEEGRREKREGRRKGGGREASAVLLGCGFHTLHNATDRQDTNMYPRTYRCLFFLTEMP